MDLQVVLEQRAKVEEFQRRHRTGLLTLLFTDLVGSTKLKQQLGDREAVALIQHHHALVREILGRFQEGEEISTAGDSFFLVFTKPSEAVEFALLLQNRLRVEAKANRQPLLDRVGIHIGEVVVEERPDAPKPKDLYGLQVDTCARVMSLAEGDQILMTRSVFDNARQVLKGQGIEGAQELSWLNHGPYLLKGVEEPLEICEVGERGQAVLKPPPDSEKVHRHVSPDSEPVLGWRPALDQVVPGTEWILEEKLGEGGFGEVWVGRHRTLKERRVFKFCFRADRVRSLKREVTLFKLLQERVGRHPNIVAVQDVYFNEPPFYVMMEYVDGRDLKRWSDERGGVQKIPLETRLEIVAQVAEALQAAHDAGVIHRDVKPGNILVESQAARVEGGALLNEHSTPDDQRSTFNDEPRTANDGLVTNQNSEFRNQKLTVKLTDFGIGQVVSEEYLAGVTRAGFTETMVGSTSSQTGTHVYMAPELLVGKPASPQSDIYSLGVVLFQLLVGDFSRPVTTDWAKEISDPLLREDLERCFAGNPSDRFGKAGQLAKRLRALPERRAESLRKQAEITGLERAAYRRGIRRAAYVAAVIVILIGSLALFARSQTHQARRLLYIANMNMAHRAWEGNNIRRLRQLLEETEAYADRGYEWNYWQRQTHLDLKTLHHGDVLQFVAFSPDGHWIITGGSFVHFDARPQEKVVVWDAGNGQPLFTLRGSIHSVALSHDGKRIVTGRWDSTAKIWEVATGRELLTLKGHANFTPEGHANWIRSVTFSPDDKRIVTCSEDQTIKVWDAISGLELLSLKGHTNRFMCAAFSPNGERIATGSHDGTARVWDTASGQELLTLRGHTVAISSLAFVLNGQRIVTLGGGGWSEGDGLRVWEAGTGRELFTLGGKTGGIYAMAVSPDGKRIATDDADQGAKVWDAESGRELLTLRGHRGGIYSISFSPDSQRIVTGGRDGIAKVWDSASGRELNTLKGHAGPMEAVAFSADGRHIVTGTWDGTAKLWNTAGAAESRRAWEPVTLSGHSSNILCVAFAPDGHRIITGSSDQTAKVWNVVTGRELVTLSGHTNTIECVAFSPDGRRVLTGGRDQTAKVWDAATGQTLLTLRGHTDTIRSVAFSPDGHRVVTGGWDQAARIWDAATGRELLTLKPKVNHNWDFSPIVSIAFSSDGKQILTCGSSRATIWDALSGRQLRRFERRTGAGLDVAIFSPKGQPIVAGRHSIKVQDIELWEPAHNSTVRLLGHSANCMAFSPDAKRAITGGYDKTAKVWETASGREVLNLEGHADQISAVAFSPDGRRIVTGSFDKTAKVWEAASPEQVAAWRKEEKEAAKRLEEERATRWERFVEYFQRLIN